MTHMDDVLKHAALAVHDVECSSIVILMVCNGEPEVHIAIAPKDTLIMNGAVDMFKTEMIILMKEVTENKKDRK